MKAIGDLPCLGRSLTRAVSIKAGAVSVDDVDFRMTGKPPGSHNDGSVRQHIENLPPLQVHQDRSVIHAFLPAPVIDANHADLARFIAAGRVLLR